MTTNPFGNLSPTSSGGLLGSLTTPGSNSNPAFSQWSNVATAYQNALAQTKGQLGANAFGASSAATAKADAAAIAAMTPTQLAQYQQETASGAPGGVMGFINKVAPALIVGTVAAGFGGAAGAALGGGLGGALGGGAVSGAVNTAGTDARTGAPLTAGSVGKGAVTGAATGALAYAAAPATSALNKVGVPAPLSAGIVQGTAGAGVGALGAKLTGGNASDAAIAGGAGGFLSGAISNATGSNALGKASAGLGGAAISPLLSSGSGTTPATSTIGNIGTGSMIGNVGQNTALQGGASTDTTLAGTIAGALPGLLQAGAGAYGAQNAAQAQTTADQAAIGTQQTNLGNINSIWATQQGLGQGADTALGSALGTNGQPANYSNFTNMPGYQFAVQQGTQAIQRQAASLGNAYTPNTAAAVGQYVTGTASQDYNTYISQLMGAAGLGTTANQGLQTGSQQSSNNISQLQQNQGQAQAAGISGVSNAVGGLFSANGAGTGLVGAGANYLGGGTTSSGVNYGSGSGNPNGTNGLTSASDPYGANASVYNQNNLGNTGVDPSTGQPWTSGVQAPAFDSSSVEAPNYLDTGGDSTDLTDFLGGG